MNNYKHDEFNNSATLADKAKILLFSAAILSIFLMMCTGCRNLRGDALAQIGKGLSKEDSTHNANRERVQLTPEGSNDHTEATYSQCQRFTPKTHKQCKEAPQSASLPYCKKHTPSVQCEGKTKANKRCQRKTKDRSNRCSSHLLSLLILAGLIVKGSESEGEKLRALAVRAYSGTSHSPERRAERIVKQVNTDLGAIYKELLIAAIPDEHKEAEMQQAQAKYLQLQNDWLNCRTGLISTLITGPGNFPVRRMQKKNNVLERKYLVLMKFLNSYVKRAERKYKSRGIEAVSEELAEARARVKKLTELQTAMVRENKEARASKHQKKYAGFQLTNNRARLKAAQQRVKQLEEKESAQTTVMYECEEFKVLRNAEADRYQFIFEGKPDEDTRRILKKHGMRWSPKNGAWQRKVTANAHYSIKNYLMPALANR